MKQNFGLKKINAINLMENYMECRYIKERYSIMCFNIL